MTAYQLGKTPARPGAVNLRFVDYVRRPDSLWQWILALIESLYGPVPPLPVPEPQPDNLLPPVPDSFGLDTLPDFGMQGNDVAGDCLEAGAIHETVLWTLDGYGRPAPFADDAGIQLYESWTDYNPRNPASDRGTDMTVAAKRRKKTGLPDQNGVMHTIGAYLALTPGDTQELTEATYLFGAVGVGVAFPRQWMHAFDEGRPWDRLVRPDFAGGHYIPVIGRRRNGNFVCVTWGRLQEITPTGYRQFNDESLAYVAADYLGPDGQSPAGFDMEQLKADLTAIGDS